MKASAETKRVEKPNGQYLILERRIRVRNGIRQATAWRIIFNSEIGY